MGLTIILRYILASEHALIIVLAVVYAILSKKVVVVYSMDIPEAPKFAKATQLLAQLSIITTMVITDVLFLGFNKTSSLAVVCIRIVICACVLFILILWCRNAANDIKRDEPTLR